MKISYYYFLFLAGLISICIIPLFIPYGGITADSVSYFRLADELPSDVKFSLFPLGYPLILKFFHFIFQDYFWSSRFVNILCYIAIGLFSYYKKFHFKETVVLLATKIIFYSYFNAISEGLFLTLLYFLFYYIYEFFQNRLKSYSFYIPAAIIFFLMFAVRYSAIYLLIGMGIFYLFYFFKNRMKISFLKNDFFRFLFFSGVGIGFYMLFNFFSYGDFAGEKYRHKPYLNTIGEDFVRNIISIFNSFNPVLGLKLNGHNNLIYAAEGLLFLINLFFIYFSVKIWRNYFKKNEGYFHKLLIVAAAVYTLFVFVTVFFQGIEELNIRLLAESSFCYFYSLLFICYREKIYEKKIFMFAVFSLFFNSLYVIKVPDYFLKRKAEVEALSQEMAGKKYFYINDTDFKRIEHYKIPFLNKEIKYEHQNMQDAAVNGNIMMMKNPHILWIMKDTVKNKSEVIYSSDLRMKVKR